MDDSGPTASIIVFVILLFINMFLYGFGSAIEHLNEKEVERRAEEDKDRKSCRLLKIINSPASYINTVQFIVTLSNVYVGARMLDFTPPVSSDTVISLVLILYVLVTFGILLPKRVAELIPEKWAYACITPVFFMMKILSPLTGVMALTVKCILFLFGVRAKESENDVTEEEIIDMVNEGQEQGILLASEAEMISNIFEYGDKEAQDIMTHRNDIAAIDGDCELSEAISIMLAGKNSRYPVYEENMDHIIGILHLKDALRYQKREGGSDAPVKELAGLLREPVFVPQTKNIDELFKEMQQKKVQMVMVVDEYGQTDGLLAMEDILEEIVGNIQDEYDEEKKYIVENGEDEYVIDGMTPLDELEELLDITFDTDEFETINGYLISKMDKIPEPDEEFDIDYSGYHFKVLSVENKMISSVLVTKNPTEEYSLEENEKK
ncbi:MAG: HlyC/CorC family transporter [Lachnospiraceae bacterium]|nr:HlyC/CorC family transporter [Lachnospiraceae bacterium]